MTTKEQQLYYPLGELVEAVFIRRENRFRAEVDLNGTTVKVHVPNSGRMQELLVPGAKVWIQPASGTAKQKPEATMINPPINHAKSDILRSPPDNANTPPAFKNTPEPITIPTTIAIPVHRPYCLLTFAIFLPFSINCPSLLIPKLYHTYLYKIN